MKTWPHYENEDSVFLMTLDKLLKLSMPQHP